MKNNNLLIMVNTAVVMAIQRIPGSMLESNLVREGVDLAFQTNLLYLDVTNDRIGVKTIPGAYALDVNGTARFQDDVTISADLTASNAIITGNLTVQGTTTTIDSQNLVVEDNLLFINSNNSAETDAGLMINRGSSNDSAVMYWDEENDVFRFGTTPDDGSTRTELANVTLAKIQAADPAGDDDLVTKRYFEANSGSSLTFLGDDSTGVTFSATNSDDITFAGAQGITTAVSGDTVTTVSYTHLTLPTKRIV